jgi:hypothetical protein
MASLSLFYFYLGGFYLKTSVLGKNYKKMEQNCLNYELIVSYYWKIRQTVQIEIP